MFQERSCDQFFTIGDSESSQVIILLKLLHFLCETFSRLQNSILFFVNFTPHCTENVISLCEKGKQIESVSTVTGRKILYELKSY